MCHVELITLHIYVTNWFKKFAPSYTTVDCTKMVKLAIVVNLLLTALYCPACKQLHLEENYKPTPAVKLISSLIATI